MTFLGKNACNRIIFITFVKDCISSTRRLTVQCNMNTVKLHKLRVATRNVQDLRKSLKQRDKKPVSGSPENVHI